MIKHLDLFSGIGGFALAADRVFGEVEHTFCEIDPFCQQVLKKHWPKAKIYGDIKTITNPKSEQDRGLQQSQFQPNIRTGCDLLTGGFPCQPFSQAGQRKGTEDNRYLWPEMLRVIRDFRPSWVVAENVRGLLTWNEGLVFEQVCLDLESEGYEVQPFIVPAVAVNAPHRRDRVWFVANSNGNKHRGWRRSLSETEGLQRVDRTALRSWRTGRTTKNAADTKRQGSQRHEQPGTFKQKERPSRPITQRSWDENWFEVATELCGVFNGLSPRLDEIRLNKYAKIAKKITRQDLPCLWEGFQSEAFQWNIGRFNTVQFKDYLFTVLWKLTQKSERQNNLSFESTEVQKAFLRNVWYDKEIGRPSQRWEYNKQYAAEYKDTLSQLSYEIALATEEIWKDYTKHRNERLKSLGNAIVPQVAEQIFKAIESV